MKILLLAFISIAYPFIGYAQQDSRLKNRISAQASFSMDETSEYSIGYHYLFSEYVGIGANVGSWSVNSSGGLIGEDDDSYAKRQNPFIKPSLLVKTPSLHIQQCGFHIECEPGIMFSTRQKIRKLQSDMETCKEYKTDCISLNCDFGFVVGYKDVNFTAFYSLSNLDVNREYKSKGQNDYKKKLVESVGLKIGLFF